MPRKKPAPIKEFILVGKLIGIAHQINADALEASLNSNPSMLDEDYRAAVAFVRAVTNQQKGYTNADD